MSTPGAALIVPSPPKDVEMFKRHINIITFIFCFLIVSPQASAFCLFSSKPWPRIFFDEPVPELKSEADVVIKIRLLTSMFGDERWAAASAEQPVNTSGVRIRQGEIIAIRHYSNSECETYFGNEQGTIIAQVGTDIEGRLMLCPYLNDDGRLGSPYVDECTPGKVEEARKTKLAADKGDARAQIAIGLMYEEGRHIRRNNDEALKWFKRAAESGDAEARYELGMKYQRDKEDQEAFKWLKLAADQGQVEAMYHLGRIYEYGKLGVEHNVAEAMKWHARAAEQGHKRATDNLEELKKMEPLLHAAGKGDAEAQCKLGEMYRWRNNPEALKWLKLAADQGQVEAMYELGDIYGDGKCGVERNEEEAVQWFTRAADQGHLFAKQSLRPIKEKRDLKLAAKSGDVEALYDLGDNYWGSYRDRERSAVEAVKWFKLAAAQGDAGAMFRLGEIFRYGRFGPRGIEQNQAEAVRWFKLAADRGNNGAMHALGDIYSSGFKGLKQDKADVEAAKWFSRAAEQGYAGSGHSLDKMKELESLKPRAKKRDPEAQFKLGEMYRFNSNSNEAVKWYTMAADNGNLEAMNKLWVIYEFGDYLDIAPNKTEAKKWRSRAEKEFNKRNAE